MLLVLKRRPEYGLTDAPWHIVSVLHLQAPQLRLLTRGPSLTGLLIFILPINYGYEASLIGKLYAIPSFLDHFGRTLPNGKQEIPANDQQTVSAAFFSGIFLAAFLNGFLSDMLGRRKVIFIGSTLCIAGIFVQAFANSIINIFGGKLISTLGFGLGHSLAPVYVAEVVPDHMRGICLTLINTMIVLGGWACALVGLGGSYIDSDWGWRMPILTQLAPPISMLVLGFFLLPESPSWLVLKGRDDEAAESVRKFRGNTVNPSEIVVKLKAAIEQERELNQAETSYMDCFKGVNRRRTIIACMTYLTQQFVGSSFVSAYLP